MHFRGVAIIIWQHKAFLPSFAKYKSGIIVQVDPVYVTDLSIHGLVPVINKVLSSDLILLPDPAPDEWKIGKKAVLLAATGARNWKELAKKSLAYGLTWESQAIRLDPPHVDKQGRWAIDPNKVQFFPIETPLETIVDVVLEDIQKRLSLLE